MPQILLSCVILYLITKYFQCGVSEYYLLNFLQDLLPFCEGDNIPSNKEHQNPASDRQAKINRYKQTKELKSNIMVSAVFIIWEIPCAR